MHHAQPHCLLWGVQKGDPGPRAVRESGEGLDPMMRKMMTRLAKKAQKEKKQATENPVAAPSASASSFAVSYADTCMKIGVCRKCYFCSRPLNGN